MLASLQRWFDVLYILLGGFLTLLGGFVAQFVESHYGQIREDRNVLFQAARLLLDYSACTSIRTRGHRTPPEEAKLHLEEVEIHRRLSEIALRVRSCRYRYLAVELTKFALDEQYRTKEKLEDRKSVV